MAKFRKLIITTAGFDFLTQAVADNTAIAFSRVVLAAQNYTDEEIANLTALTDPMQAITNLGIVKPSPETIQITAMMSNSAVESGYSYSSIGLFVKSANGEEVLFAVSGADSPGDIPPNTSPFSARLELFLTVSNAEQITFTIDDNVICGTHGIYVGSGDMPEGYDIQIDPTGEALLLDNEMSDESENVPKTKVVKAYADKLNNAAKAYTDKLNNAVERRYYGDFTEPLKYKLDPYTAYLIVVSQLGAGSVSNTGVYVAIACDNYGTYSNAQSKLLAIFNQPIFTVSLVDTPHKGTALVIENPNRCYLNLSITKI